MPAVECVDRAKWSRPRRCVCAIALAACAATAHAQNKCTATGVMAGEKFSITHCAAAVYPDSNSLTIWFNEGPITPQEAKALQNSAHADSSKGGEERKMLLVAFYPGGDMATADSGAVKSIDLGLSHAKSAMAGAQWVVEAPKDFRVDRIAGDVKPGSKLTGRITGSRSSDGRPYSWDPTFDVTLPMTEAASGMTCGK